MDRFLSVNDVVAKSPVLALSAPGWVGPGGRNLEILFGAVAGDARNSVSEERIGLTSLGDSPVARVLLVVFSYSSCFIVTVVENKTFSIKTCS